MLAFSGGLDSTALLHLCASFMAPWQLALAHLNHQLRGDDADADMLWAQKVAADLGLSFYTKSIDVRALANDRGLGIEEAARTARYGFLAEAAQAFPASFVLTAHQADDQAETMLLSFVKGGGALAGIPWRRPLPLTTQTKESPIHLLRPLLPFSRSELRAWLESQNITWREDHSNSDTRYLRNSLRHNVMPSLYSLNPRLNETLGRISTIRQDEEDYWRKTLKDLWVKLVKVAEKNIIIIRRLELNSLHPAEQRRLIYQALSTLRQERPANPLPMAAVETARQLSLSQRADHPGLDLPGGVRAATTTSELHLSPASRYSNN